MNDKERRDLLVLAAWPLIAVIISLVIPVSVFASVILFFGIPSLYLSIRGSQYVKKSAFFSAVTGIPFIIVMDYLAHINQQWVTPDSIIPWRIGGYVTFEILVWAFLNTFLVVMFYEYFLDQHKSKKLWTSRMRYCMWIMAVMLLVFIFTLLVFPSILYIPYFYLWFGLFIILIPLSIELWRRPKLFKKFSWVAVYFSFLHTSYELIGLHLGWWVFPESTFIGWVTIFGLAFPVEELFFWIILFSMAVLAWYEFFDDDEK